MVKRVDGSKRWPSSNWHVLLKLAIQVLDGTHLDTLWRLGGGTAIALQIDHRISKDVDIFIAEVGALDFLHPNRNTKVRALSDRIQVPGHYIKIERPEGEIDFLTNTMGDRPLGAVMLFDNREVYLESPGTIVEKKLRYRRSTFATRDIFDLAAVLDTCPDERASISEAIQTAGPAFLDRIQKMCLIFRHDCDLLISPTESGRRYVDEAFAIIDKTVPLPLWRAWQADGSFAARERRAIVGAMVTATIGTLVKCDDHLEITSPVLTERQRSALESERKFYEELVRAGVHSDKLPIKLQEVEEWQPPTPP